MHINPNKAGLALGGLFGAWHVLWSLLVAFGLAQGLLDFMFRLHMLEPLQIVRSFDLITAASLVVVASVTGYVLGQVFAWFWNRLHK